MEQFYEKDKIEAGIDEAGRGCLFGPVSVACVIWSQEEHDPNIIIRDSKKMTPKQKGIAYEYISETTPLDIRAGDNVILGASKKDRDYERWKGAAEYRKKKQGVNVLAGEEYAVEPSVRSDNKNFSAGDARQLISNLVTNPEDVDSLRQLTEYIPQDKIDELYRILGQPSPVAPEEVEVDLEETSTSNIAGGIGAQGGPWSTEAAAIKKANKEEKERSKLVTRSLGIAENKQTVDDVIRLLMERGIMT